MSRRRPDIGPRRRGRFAGATAAALLWGTTLVARSQPTGTAPTPPGHAAAAESFETFSLIGNLNIFDSSRVGWNPGRSAPAVDTIALVGTMESDRGRLAFFDSPNALYRRVLREGGTLAQFTVKRIEPNGVELTHDTQVIPLAIRQQLRRPAGGDWTVGGAGPAVAGGGPTEPAVPADASAVLKRLMEQRQQQLKQ